MEKQYLVSTKKETIQLEKGPLPQLFEIPETVETVNNRHTLTCTMNWKDSEEGREGRKKEKVGVVLTRLSYL